MYPISTNFKSSAIYALKYEINTPMKYLFLILFSFICHYISAQELQGIISDSKTKNAIPYSSIAILHSNKGTYADADGAFQLNSTVNTNDTLKISAIGYESKIINVSYFAKTNNTIYLRPSTETLKEVVINSNLIDYTNKITLGEKRDGNISKSTPIGYETCLYFSNPEKALGKLKTLFIKLKKNKNAEATATFNIKFYSFDSQKQLPDKLLYHENLFISPKNKKYTLKVPLEDLEIFIPPNGICIGIEMMNTGKEMPKYTQYGPALRYTLSENNKSITWSNYLNTGWKNGANIHKRFKRFKTGISNPLIQLDVLYPKR